MSNDLLTIRVDLKGKAKEKWLYIQDYHGVDAYAELLRLMINNEYRRIKQLEKIEAEKIID